MINQENIAVLEGLVEDSSKWRKLAKDIMAAKGLTCEDDEEPMFSN